MSRFIGFSAIILPGQLDPGEVLMSADPNPNMGTTQIHSHVQASVRKNKVDHLVQDCSNSIANALELLQSYAMPSKWWVTMTHSRHELPHKFQVQWCKLNRNTNTAFLAPNYLPLLLSKWICRIHESRMNWNSLSCWNKILSLQLWTFGWCRSACPSHITNFFNCEGNIVETELFSTDPWFKDQVDAF